MRGTWRKQAWRRLARTTDGAVAPTVALSLFALIAAGGIAFDYARLASMDSELQNAADQAALAAASQLDGQAGAIARATAAAKNLVINSTIMANETATAGTITVPTLTFYVSYDASADTYGTVTTTDATAKVVKVSVGTREAFYALTPVVAAFRSGAIGAEAVAGLGTAVCKVPPLMICNPKESTDPNFNIDYSGKGMLLVARNNDADAYGPGNFGFLDSGYGYDLPGGGTSVLKKALAQQNFLADCLSGNTVTTEPGASAPALDAINTRFDIYAQDVQQNATCGNGQCPPAANVRKDVMRDANNNNGGTIKNFCKPSSQDSSGKGWVLMPAAGRYDPPSNAALTLAQRNLLSPMGHPRDTCHAFNGVAGCAGGRIGDGVWDRAAYFQSNYGSATIPAALGSTPTRYDTYIWERTNLVNQGPGGYNLTPTPSGGTAQQKLYAAPVCQTPGVIPNADIDRRRLTVAVVNCNGTPKVQGKTSGVGVTKWIDIFLVEPSWNRSTNVHNKTTAEDLYVEIIGTSKITGAGGEAFQVERSVPYLIR